MNTMAGTGLSILDHKIKVIRKKELEVSGDFGTAKTALGFLCFPKTDMTFILW
jgi:hypothetical protein